MADAIRAQERPESRARVNHAEWGADVVHGFDDGRILVPFDEIGYRMLGHALVEERRPLGPATA